MNRALVGPPGRAALLLVGFVLPFIAPAFAATGRPPGPAVVAPPPVPLDINNLSVLFSNAGSFAYDYLITGPGLEYPKGTGKTAVFSSGLWLGATVGGQTRLALSEYADEFAPGAMIGSNPDDPGKAEYKVFELDRVYGSTAARDAALADYNAGAVPHGAPVVTVLPSGELDILGDEMLWHVFNDADPANHFTLPGGTTPLGIEVQQTAFAFNRPGPLGNAVFLKFELINKGANTLDDFHAAFWSDPDLGQYTDDLVGCDPSTALGYCYNATNNDAVYGSSPPAIGYNYLQGVLVPGGGGQRHGLSAFVKYINGTDPSSATQTFNYMHGLNPDGSPIIDPTTTLPTTFVHPGDPVTGTGWLDSNPSDRRMLLVSGPSVMAPGDTDVVVLAIVVGQGNNRLGSISALRAADQEVQRLYESGFMPPTATQVALVSAQAEAGRASLVWHGGDAAGAVATVYRGESGSAWTSLGTIVADGSGRFSFEDASVASGRRYGYRLGLRDDRGAEQFFGEAWVEIPTVEFALQGAKPNPAVGDLDVSFSLPDAAPARLELLDLAGRRLVGVDVGALGAGRHVVKLSERARLAPGLYVVRLTRAARTLTVKAPLIR